MKSDVETTANGMEGSSHTRGRPYGSQNESKLELFGFDSLVNILGLKRYVKRILYFFIKLYYSMHSSFHCINMCQCVEF